MHSYLVSITIRQCKRSNVYAYKFYTNTEEQKDTAFNINKRIGDDNQTICMTGDFLLKEIIKKGRIVL